MYCLKACSQQWLSKQRLSFWLLSLVVVGSSERPLSVAAHGVARSTGMPALPGTSSGLPIQGIFHVSIWDYQASFKCRLKSPFAQ